MTKIMLIIKIKKNNIIPKIIRFQIFSKMLRTNNFIKLKKIYKINKINILETIIVITIKLNNKFYIIVKVKQI